MNIQLMTSDVRPGDIVVRVDEYGEPYERDRVTSVEDDGAAVLRFNVHRFELCGEPCSHGLHWYAGRESVQLVEEVAS